MHYSQSRILYPKVDTAELLSLANFVYSVNIAYYACLNDVRSLNSLVAENIVIHILLHMFMTTYRVRRRF